MKNAFFSLFILGPMFLFAQMGQNMQCPMCGRMYNPQTVETLSGTIVKVESVAPTKMGTTMGVQIILKTNKETIPVHLGPSWYLDHQEMTFQAKDQVTVTGSRVTMNKEAVILAQSITKGDETLVLRDAQGIPYWSGMRKQSMQQ